MTALTRIHAAPIEASLNFMEPMAERPAGYQYDPPPEVTRRPGGDYAPHRVPIRDARPLAAWLDLDAEGFALLQAPTAFASFDDAAAIRAAYYPEVERLIADAAGATRAIAFDHNVRNAARAGSGEPGIRGPVQSTHNDFTARSGRDRALLEMEARGLDAELLQGRFAIINLWRPIGRPVEKWPLALCDARTIADGDLIVKDLIYRDRVGETYALWFNPAQRWFHFPHLRPEEAILIKGYDSAEQVARFTAHSAFEDPTSRPDAPERESIEVRALVFYPD